MVGHATAPEGLPVPYVSELCLFAAAFIAAYAYGEEVVARVKSGGRRLVQWRRKDRDGWR
jgi:hypothetical protein